MGVCEKGVGHNGWKESGDPGPCTHGAVQLQVGQLDARGLSRVLDRHWATDL